MRAKGALHIHSQLSHDGTLTIAELASWYRGKGYQFLAMGEHAEDLNVAKVQALVDESARNSDDKFCVLPGIEFAVTRHMHIVGLGVTRLIPPNDPVTVVHEIHQQGGFAILAHPMRIGWQCAADVLQAIDAAEIWNVGYDGKYLPSPVALSGFRGMQQLNPNLLAVASHDFHRTASYYDLGIEMEVALLSREPILQNLQNGRYVNRSRFFRADARARVSPIRAGLLNIISRQLRHIRNVRALFLRFTA